MVSTRQSSNSSSSSSGSTTICISYKMPINYNAEPSTTATTSSSSSSSSSTASTSMSAAAQHIEDNSHQSNINLLDLPIEILQKILGYLEFNKIAHLRLICHQMDKVCGSILNSTFQRLQTQMLNRFQAIKSQMPRRESARRNHPLACESDIIETLHMRLTLLQMSFGKHIERKHCCFFPGEILDEVYRILHYIKVTPKLARPYKVTDELFDLSTMAMEYFKDCIEPRLPEIPYFGAEFLDLAGTFSSNKFSLCLDTAPLSVADGKARGGSGSNSGGESSPSRSGNDEPGGSNGLVDAGHAAPSSPPQSNMVLRKRIRKIKQGMKRYNSQLSLMRRDLRNCKAKIAEQQKQLGDYATRLDDNDKKNEETSRKFSTLLQELNKCKTELQYWRSKSPAIPVCFGCGQSIPLPTEEQQALANQGVLSNVEASASDELDFIPIAEVSVHSPTEQEVTQAQQQLLQHAQSSCMNSSSCSSSSFASSTAITSESMAPPKAPPLLSSCSTSSTSSISSPMPLISSKRKANSSYCLDDEVAKKPRRALKSRQAKRSKL